MKNLYKLLLVGAITFFATKPISTNAQVNTIDSLALVDLYNSTGGPYWKHNKNWLNGPVSKWDGIYLSGNRVSMIYLNDNRLTGNLPSSIGNLDSLVALSLYSNRLKDSIPSTIKNLIKLTELELSHNKLTGGIPIGIGKLVNLKKLSLADNNLKGEIPVAIGNLANLQEIWLYDNLLSASIPSAIGNLVNLKRLWIYNNSLSGNIPTSIGNLVQLTDLSLGGNKLTGAIPASITNLINLHVLDLSYNQLTDDIPSLPASLGKSYDGYFNRLKLDHNMLTGNIPTLGNDSSKRSFDDFNLSYNKLTGNIPSYIGYFTISYDYGEFDLSHNNLTGSIPVSFKNLVTPEIYLDHNDLTGEIPIDFGNLTLKAYYGSIVTADLSYNKLSGTIPASLNKMSDQNIILNLSHNKLSGSIPQTLGNKDVFYLLDLSNNELSGSIPGSIYQLYNLSYLYLDSNQLSGKLNDNITNLGGLSKLNLSHNNLSGALPKSLDSAIYLRNFYLSTINLSHNSFSGNIKNINALNGVTSLDLSSNQFSGDLPQSLFKNFYNLEFLSLAKNQFTGNIPSSLTRTYYIKSIDVSNNLLGEKVPAFLTKLEDLYSLNIAHNSYTFDGLETIVLHGYETFQYGHQAIIPVKKSNNVLYVNTGGTLSNNTYKWFKDGALVSTITGDSTFTPTASGNYSVEATNSIATELTLYSDTITFSAFTEGQQNNMAAIKAGDKNSFSVYPNPAKTTATVVFNETGNCTIKLTDVSGRVLQTKTVTAVKDGNILQLDVSNYAAGMYLIIIVNNKGQSHILKLRKE